MTVFQQGQRLGPYTIEAMVGRGGMGEVYSATHETLARGAAIKVLNPALNADPTFPLRFLREAKTVASLRHPNIITVYDFGIEGEVSYLVMELAPGGTLRGRADQLRTLAEVVEALSPIGSALQYAHARGIIHRDLKPQNILIADDDRMLLADFGLARVLSETLNTSYTESAAGFGTPNYMAPEQALGQDTDARSDIYALGIMTYELLTGTVPYRGTSSLAVMHQHVSAPPPLLSAVLPAAPPRLDAVILRATAKLPRDRFSSADEFTAALRSATAETPGLPVGAAAVAAAAAHATASGQPPRSLKAEEERAALFTPAPWAERRSRSERRLEAAGAGATGDVAALSASETEAGAALTRRRWATSFSRLQWLTLALAAVIVVAINGIGLWLKRAGLSAANGNVAHQLTTFIGEHLTAFKSSLATLAVLFALLAVLSMRRAVIDEHQVGAREYAMLRRYHRFVGYCAILIAVTVGLLTCAGIFGFGTASPRAALHSVLGSALLVTMVVKLAVVRYYPAQRRHLQMLGEGLLVLFLLVFATSAVPFVWSRIVGA